MIETAVGSRHGFTLIELITVVVIIAMISAVVVSRWAGSENETISGLDIIKSHLRYAQSKAMSSSNNWYIHFEQSPSPGKYTLYMKDPEGGPDALLLFPTEPVTPEEQKTYVEIKPGISLSADMYILFDRLGRPYPNTTGTPGTQLAATRTVVTSPVGNVEVRPETGFIP